MSRRRRRVKIKSSSRLFAVILFNLLLASCITAHYLQEESEDDFELKPTNEQKYSTNLKHDQAVHQHQIATQGISSASSTRINQYPQQQQQQQQHLVHKIASISVSSQSAQSNLATSNQLNNNNSPQETQANLSSSSNQDDEQDDETGPTSETSIQQQQHHTTNRPHLQQPTAPVTINGLPSVADLCSRLPTGQFRHLKLCKLIGRSPAADETVALGAARGLAECRDQFKAQRWNCTHLAGDHHLLTSRLAQSLGNRESAFVQAIAAAGIVHTIATACSSGTLSDCACDKSRVGLIRQKDQIWKWGGCSNNIRHGMMFAKHLVELLDAVHWADEQQQQQSLVRRRLQRRSVDGLSHLGAESLTPQQVAHLCQKNQNISQTTHIQLIKSLLAKNSLERHQDFRLAMNMHNNKVGRMAVAKNMEIKCRCHGLSGSCSLKTCWLRLPNFQQIGAYLKRKYDGSIHLPLAVNVNRLIPMMDRHEISAILLAQSGGLATAVPAPQFAALTNGNSSSTLSSIGNSSVHLSYYERHKQLMAIEQQLNNNKQTTPNNTNGTSLLLHGYETPIPITPMSQHQYQALLREMKWCHMKPVVSHQLNKRDLVSRASNQLHQHHHLHNHKHQQHYIRKHQHHSQQTPSSGSQTTSTIQGTTPNQHHHLIGQLLEVRNRDDLVHLHRSPDYCEPDPRQGFAGISERTCSRDPRAPDNCDKLCCGRGYQRRETQIRFDCECKFQYCCKIHCNYCHKSEIVHVCK